MKKSILVLALAFSASAMAINPVANVVWSGFVPGSVAGDDLIITGLAGQSIENGQLIVSTEGKFTSTAVVVEAHDYVKATTTTGALASANWTLSNAQVSYSGGASNGAVLVVKDGATTMAVGTPVTAKKTLSLSIEQTAALTAINGGSVQAQVTIVAEKAV